MRASESWIIDVRIARAEDEQVLLPIYAHELVERFLTLACYSTPEQIAALVYEAATDGKDQLRYVAGADAQATYAARLQVGEETFRKGIEQRFFG